MNEIILITVSTRTPDNPESGWLALYLKQLAEAGVDSHLEMIESFPNQGGGGTLGAKVAKLRELVQRFYHYQNIIITDAFDVQFFGTREDLIAKMPESWVVLAAEKNCYPEPELAAKIPQAGPWCYVNGGCLCGTPAWFMVWLEEIEKHRAYEPNALDQGWFNRRLSERDPIVRIDYMTNIFYCLFNEGVDLDFENGIPVNTFYGSRPSFIHANGQSNRSDIWERYTRSLL